MRCFTERRPAPAARGVGRRAARLALVAAALQLTAFTVAADDAAGLLEPIPWRDAARLALPMLQLPFESPAVLEPGRVSLSLRTLYASSIGHGKSASLSVDFATETAQPSAVLRWGLRRGLELHVEVPALVDEAGFLNDTIRAVERTFAGSANPLRRGPQARSSFIRLARPDGRLVLRRGTDAGAGDVWVGLKARVRDQDGALPAVALRVALKLPTGQFPDGSGTLELGVGALAAWRAGHTSVFAAADLALPSGAVSPLRLATRPHPSFQLGLARELPWRLALELQLSAHAPAYAPVGLRQLDAWSFYLVGGVRVRATRSLFVDFALAENLFVTEAGADVSSLLRVEWRF